MRIGHSLAVVVTDGRFHSRAPASEPMNSTMLVAVVFAVLLGIEWRYRLPGVRLGTALLALVVLWFAQPLPHRAARQAMVAPPAERVTELPGVRSLSEYESGVVTMERAVGNDSRMGAKARLLGLGVLFWLACSPVFMRALRPATGTARPDVVSGKGNVS